MLHSVFSILLVTTPFHFAQAPADPPPPTGLGADVGLQEALAQARSSGLPHRMLLADHIDTLIEDKRYAVEEDFKIGAMATLRHSDFSKDLVLGELYLRMLQQPVIDDVRDGFAAAARITIDGDRRDWPGEFIATLGKKPSDAKKSPPQAEPWLKSFGAIRSEEALLLLIETNRKFDSSSKVIFTLEVSRLADRFNDVACRVNIVGKQARFFDREGEEFKLHDDLPIDVAAGPQLLEIRIPLKRFAEDLRSFVARGYVLDLQSKEPPIKSPWLACASGPIADPTAMLIDFATRRELPLNNGLPAAIALQEGLLLARSHPDVAAEIRKDAYAWLELALDISARLEIQGTQPIEKQPLAAQLAWSCRHNGASGLNSLEEYQSMVVSPDTLRNLRGFAERQGWLAGATSGKIRGSIAQFTSSEFKVFDFPDTAAREKGKDFEDSRAEAYLVKGKDRFLSYRDVGINQRWKLFEAGAGLKGSAPQALALQRALHLAAGLPALEARHSNAENDAAYILSFDSKTRNWHPAGTPLLKVSPKTTIRLQWVKPWTRPERFALQPADIDTLPQGPARTFLDSDIDEVPAKRFENLLTKGISDPTLSKPMFPPLRMR